MSPARTRRIEPAEPGGEPVCLLTAEGARNRKVPIDRLLALGEFEPAAAGYRIRLPPGDESRALAHEFVQEEAACCASLALEVAERGEAIVVSASF